MSVSVKKIINNRPITAVSYLKWLWKSRQLISTFAMRDLSVQYAQTYLGLLWSIIQPLTGLIIFTFFFQRVISLQTGVPYAAFAFTGIMGWFYFTALVGHAGTALMHNQQIIRKIHFPKLVLPLSKVLTGLVEFGISLIILLLVLWWSGFEVTWRVCWLPLAIVANITAGLSVGIWLSVLTVRYRDLHHIIPFLVGFGIWLTPVFYPGSMVPAKFSWIYYVHPPANVIAIYRWIFLDYPLPIMQVCVSMVLASGMLVTGFYYFIRHESQFADYI